MSDESFDPLKDSFELRETSQHVKIICKVCKQVWAWPLTKPLSVGATLELLNHVGSHPTAISLSPKQGV